MLSKIIDSTRSKPCSCSDLKHCPGCRAKALQPRVHLEDPHRLTIPIVISHYKHRSPITVNRSTERRWPFSSGRTRDDTGFRPLAICRWIRKKRALRQLKAAKEREKQRQRNILRREREIEFIQQLQEQEKYREPEPEIVIWPKTRRVVIKKEKKPKPVKTKEPKPEKKKKPKKEKIKESKIETKQETRIVTKNARAQFKSTYAKPKAESKVVSVKKYCRHQSISERFVNCFYRCCCQLYCCLTILIAIGMAIILLI